MTNEQKLINLIESTSIDSVISIEDIKKTLENESNLEICGIMYKYLSNVIATDGKMTHFSQILKSLLNEIQNLNIEERNDMLVKIHKLYSNMLLKLKKIELNEDSLDSIDSLKDAIDLVKNFIENLSFVSKLEQDKFNFIWYIINELKAIEFFRLLIKKQPNFINVLDENSNSLFSLACDQYLENYDPYYLTLIAVILESNNFMLNKIELEIIESKINQELTHNTQYPLQIKRLSLLLNHYFGKDKENFELTNAANTITKVPLITETSPYDEILYKPDYFERLDLSSLYTVSFKYNTTLHSGGTETAVSIVDRGDTFDLYYHIIDLPEFIPLNGQMDERAQHQSRYFHFRSLYRPLFNPQYVSKYAMFKPNNMKLAITIKITLDKRGYIKKVLPCESVIKLDKVYSSQTLGYALKNGTDPELMKIVIMVNKLRKRRQASFNDQVFTIIQTELKILVNRAVAALADNLKKPFIYKNFLTINELDSVATFSDLTKYSQKIWDKRSSKRLEKIYTELPLQRIIYSDKYLGHEYFKLPYGPISNPTQKFIALENLRLLKKFIISNCDTEAEFKYWQERMLIDTTIANASNSKSLQSEPQIKKLLLNQRENGRIDV